MKAKNKYFRLLKKYNRKNNELLWYWKGYCEGLIDYKNKIKKIMDKELK
jgi:hypothetical protein